MLQRISPGQKQRISAKAWNAAMDVAEAFSDGSLDPRTPPRGTSGDRYVLVQNNSGGDLDRLSVLGIDVPLILPTDDLNQFKNEDILSGVAPAAAHIGGGFCVLQQPLSAGAIGRAIVLGVTPVQLNVVASTDTYADAVASVTGTLSTGTSGSARILWKESGTGTKWGVVSLTGSPLRSAEAITKTITQAAHGFTVGQVLKNATGAYALAKADTAANAQVVGVVTAVIDTGTFIMTMAGYTSALSGLTAGSRYYLSAATAGALTATAPTVPVVVYNAISSTTAIIYSAGAKPLPAISWVSGAAGYTSGSITLGFDLNDGDAFEVDILAGHASSFSSAPALVTATSLAMKICGRMGPGPAWSATYIGQCTSVAAAASTAYNDSRGATLTGTESGLASGVAYTFIACNSTYPTAGTATLKFYPNDYGPTTSFSFFYSGVGGAMPPRALIRALR